MSEVVSDHGVVSDHNIHFSVNGTTAYIAGIKAAVITEPRTTRLFAEPDRKPVSVAVKGMSDPPEMVPWGEGNDLPVQLVDKAYKLPQMTSDLWINIVASYGDGIKPVRIINDGGQQTIEPYTGNSIPGYWKARIPWCGR